MVSGVLNGDLAPWGLKLPPATEGIRLALGADYRSEMLYLHPDENFAAGNGSGQGFAMPRVDGSYDVAELYLEGLVPIVQDARGARDLSLELGYRYSDYNLAGSHPTWKAQLSYAPTEDLKLRGGVARATRAPNVVELFEPQQLAGDSYEDPCAGSEPTATLEQCVRTGVRPEQYGHIVAPPVAAWNNATWGGNPELDPETGDTLTFGIVLTPRGAPGLSTTLDYWDIQMEETIGLILPEDTVAACMRTGDPLVCSWIHRDAAGTLWLTPDGYVVATNRNVGELTSRGIDLNVSYLLPVGRAGILSLGLVGTYTLESSIATYLLESSVATPIRAYDCAGYFGQQCGVPNPWWRHRMVVNWETTFDTVLSLGWRYIGPSTNDDASPDPDLADPGRIEAWEASGASELHAYSYLDLSATYNFTNSIQLTAGVNNVLDIEPPLGPGLWDVDLGPGFYGTYDPWGRFIYASLRFDF